MQKLKKHEPKISPNAALKFPFLHNVKHETSSGNDVAIAKNNAPATVALKFNFSPRASVTYVIEIDTPMFFDKELLEEI